MGTNYYWHEKSPCKYCGRAYEPLHIGKSSAGWCFSLHVIPERRIKDLGDWEHLWRKAGTYIENESGDRLTPEEMQDQIVNRAGGRAEWSASDYRDNHAEPGPYGLARHIVDGWHCIKHGAGTWDCITGEFS